MKQVKMLCTKYTHWHLRVCVAVVCPFVCLGDHTTILHTDIKYQIKLHQWEASTLLNS